MPKSTLFSSITDVRSALLSLASPDGVERCPAQQHRTDDGTNHTAVDADTSPVLETETPSDRLEVSFDK